MRKGSGHLSNRSPSSSDESAFECTENDSLLYPRHKLKQIRSTFNSSRQKESSDITQSSFVGNNLTNHSHQNYQPINTNNQQKLSTTSGSSSSSGGSAIVHLKSAERRSVHTRKSSSPSTRKTSSSICCICNCFVKLWRIMGQSLCRKKQYEERQVHIGRHDLNDKFVSNIIRNQKYSLITFLPVVLFNQFKFFLNLYFLLMACSQFIPQLKVGLLYTYWAPLCFVILVTLIREAVDDILRYKRDKSVNSQLYRVLTPNGVNAVASAKICVGDIIIVDKDQRVPADMIFLKTSEKSGSCFIRTDQLDGETDWKLRLAVTMTQELEDIDSIFSMDAFINAEEPRRDIHNFKGKFTLNNQETSINLQNTLWANTVVASGTATGVVIYTGPETRSVMNNLEPRSKVCQLDLEVNDLTKVLFIVLVVLATAMIVLKGFSGPWFFYLFRFVLLFSYIIPISLRVNLEMGRVAYSYMVQRDLEIPGTVVRTKNISEDLGRIAYLLTDKTGTLTRNEMVFKKIHLGKKMYGHESFDEVAALLKASFAPQNQFVGSHRRQDSSASTISSSSEKRLHTRHMRVDSYEIDRDTVQRLHSAVLAIALCHNVTPSSDNDEPYAATQSSKVDLLSGSNTSLEKAAVSIPMSSRGISYQASSPDEVALVQWTEKIGLALIYRDRNTIRLKNPYGVILTFDILRLFPFSPETRRMGIIVRDLQTKEILFLMKGADTVMTQMITYSDWLQEQCGNMARNGLRTLVVARKFLSEEQYNNFAMMYDQASLCMHDRDSRLSSVMANLEKDLELLCLTGVEDRLQEGVPASLRGLQDAGIKIWMLTGDKLETAQSIAKSSQLVRRNQEMHVFKTIKTRSDANVELNNFRRRSDCPLVINGDDLDVCLKNYPKVFMDISCQCPAVICCRCSPTQKAEVVKLIQNHTKRRACAIGDGGNDVSMIQTAAIGVGIVGKEGQQASLAADFSITQFSFLYKLILLHGRYSYKRSAALCKFIIHRGLIITTMQAIFSSIFYFASVALYPSLLLVGYCTIYTMFPVFSLVLDKDLSPNLVMRYPEMYKQIKNRSLSYKSFFVWVLISIYQGGVIMYGAMLLFDDELIHVVAITFTTVIFTELLMLVFAVHTWHWLMVVAELISLSFYVLTLILFPQYFDEQFIQTVAFIFKVLLLTLVSCVPLFVLKFLVRKISPPSHCKLT